LEGRLTLKKRKEAGHYSGLLNTHDKFVQLKHNLQLETSYAIPFSLHVTSCGYKRQNSVSACQELSGK
jgi:hypothetical protein